MRITRKSQVYAYALVATIFAALVPHFVMAYALTSEKLSISAPILLVASLVPLLIMAPSSFIVLLMLRRINNAMTSLDHIIKFDQLTGLLSRNYFLSVVQAERRNQGCFAIADADYFKKINDAHGHEGGDFALKHLGKVMAKVLARHAELGRLGGEEFGIYMPGVSLSQARLLMTTLNTALRGHVFSYAGQDIVVTLSIGLVEDNLTSPLSSTMRRADHCLYQAKALGRDQCVAENELDRKGASAA